MNNKASILIVEDERLVAEDIKVRLQSMGYHIMDVIDSGAKALDFLQTSKPNLILMDIILQGELDGVETAKLIKQKYYIPIIFLTSHADEHTLARVKKTLPSGYVVKPFLDDELNVAVDTALYKYRMESELRQREAWLKTTLASIGDGVIATDLFGNIVFINTVAAILTGWSEKDAVGISIQEVFKAYHAEKSYNLSDIISEVVESKKYLSQDNLLLECSDQSRILTEINLAPIRNDQDETLGAVLVFRDVTQRERVKAELEKERSLLAARVSERTEELSVANAELAQAVRLKDEFLANMSHELRTPLNAILGMSEALQENVYGIMNERQNHSLKIIQESGHHLLALINDILDISKIDAGKIEFQVGIVDVNRLIASCLSMIKQNAYKKSLSIHSHINTNVTSFRADERRLKQILVNLLSNAVKFTPGGGEIFLNVDGDPERESLKFQIRDTGIGIAEKDMDSLFQPFVQLDSRLSRAHSGTGLGLALVRRLTEMHGGGISLESEIGAGSCFTVTIPWIKEIEDSKITASTIYGNSTETVNETIRNKTLLIVDDNEHNLQAITDYLTCKELKLLIARNGVEAINLYKNESPDLVIMDIQMPGMDGLEAIRRIRSIKKESPVPIIALTALAMPGDRERCINGGANDYLSKPVSLKVLFAAVIKQLNSGSST